MTWTAPMVFTANTVLTAAQLNTHLRDNLLETGTAKVTAAGQYVVSAGRNRVTTRKPVSARVNTGETTDSQDFTDLATVGPAVTATTGTRAFIFHGSHISTDGANGAASMSWAISGATERDASVLTDLRSAGLPVNKALRASNVDLHVGLTPGENTFTAKYRTGASTATFTNRFICVFPL